MQKSVMRRITDQPREVLRYLPDENARWLVKFNRVELLCAPLGPLANVRDYVTKHTEHVAKISGVREVITTRNEFISDQTMYAAIAISNWYFDSFIYLMSKNCIPEEIKFADLLDGWLNQRIKNYPNFVFPKNHLLEIDSNCVRSESSLETVLRVN